MLAYYKGGFNEYTIRVDQATASSSLHLVIYTEDMTTQDTYSAVFSPNQFTYDPYESMVTFSYNFDGTQPPPPVGTQYRAKLAAWQSGSGQALDSNIIWHGSFSVFQSQSISKPEYTNQIPLSSGSISHDTFNEYIILT
jgi:hypothetical protein